jgi:hypothetical protein
VKTEDDNSMLQNATLPERMRAAAEVLVEASRRYDGQGGAIATDFATTSWDAANLRIVADRWENQDRESGQVADLASALFNAGWHRVTTDQAKQLIADGWTRQDR